MPSRLHAIWARVCADRRGSTMTMFALVAPVLILVAAATAEYASLAARHTQLQTAVDGAALTAAQQLRLSNNTDAVVASIARAAVQDTAPPKKENQLTVTTVVQKQRTAVTVDVRETVATYFGQILQAPTMDIRVSATAQLSGTAKLCLLTLDVSKGKVLNLDKDSVITAQDCAIYSNSTDKKGLSAEKGATATASLICSAGGVEQKNGALLRPAPILDCPVSPDPLAATPRPSVGSCLASDLKVTTLTTLFPGTYCGGIEVKGSGRLTLSPGIYVMNDGPLVVSGSGSLSGENVGIFFTGNKGGLRFDPDTSISLTAPKTGAMAGLLFFEDRSVGSPAPPPDGPKGAPPPPPYGSQPMRQYQITSNNAPTLLGTIYLPAGRLIIDASRPVADRSAYTVIVARQVEINSGPNLFLNSNYGATDIPVPQGVGNRSGNVALTR